MLYSEGDVLKFLSLTPSDRGSEGESRLKNLDMGVWHASKRTRFWLARLSTTAKPGEDEFRWRGVSYLRSRRSGFDSMKHQTVKASTVPPHRPTWRSYFTPPVGMEYSWPPIWGSSSGNWRHRYHWWMPCFQRILQSETDTQVLGDTNLFGLCYQGTLVVLSGLTETCWITPARCHVFDVPTVINRRSHWKAYLLHSQRKVSIFVYYAVFFRYQKNRKMRGSVRICVVSILRFFIIDLFMIVFPTVFISYLSEDLSFVQARSLSLMYWGWFLTKTCWELRVEWPWHG